MLKDNLTGIKGSAWLALCLPLLLSAALLLPSCRLVSGQRPDRVLMQLKWVHQAEFAGFYMAREKGYYERENIEVTFLEGERDLAIVQRVVFGEADFAVLPAESILTARGRGQPVTAVAAIYRQSPVVYVASTSSGILKPTDFVGRTIATQDASGSQQDLELQFTIMMRRLGLDTTTMKLIAWDPYYTNFYDGKADVTSCHSSSGLIEMKSRGLKLNYIWPSDYGVYFYSDMLATRDGLLAENPELVERFLRATLRGWQDVVEDYEQAVPVVVKYARIKDPQVQLAMLEAQLPLVHTGEDHVGWMRPDDWQAMYGAMRDHGMLDSQFDVSLCYDHRFLDRMHGGEAK
jgi:NitT/TauT family transport system substrate-binding protein